MKPNPRVASNHLTRPMIGASSEGESSSTGSNLARASPSASCTDALATALINMSACVGKPTLIGSKRCSLGQILDFDLGPWRQTDDCSCEGESMAGPDHRRNGTFAVT